MKIYTKDLLSVRDESQFKEIKTKYDRSCHVEFECSECKRLLIGKLRYLNSFPCICGNCKSKLTRFSKYGPTGISKEGLNRLSVKQKLNAKERIEKGNKTKLERYGDSNYNNPEKAIKTKLEIYGTLYDREKHVEACRLKYGVDFYTQTEDFKKKVRETAAKQGVAWPSQLEISKVNSVNTCLKRYGVKFTGQSKEIREKITNTCIKKYGLPFAPQHFAPARSKIEDSVLEFIDTLSIKYVTNNRTLLNGKEIDILFPDLKKAIEVQGTYWHADPRVYESSWYNKAKNMTAEEIWKYDEEKTENINKLGITIFHLWEIDWTNDKENTKIKIREFLQNG